ncbi:MAG: hypothetical protein D8M57_05320 [Candidatus Scalindua sp. AMX11]|nr:MAG: hypothetical protein DWQ00_07465 [Candidatus Scalindua sp.]TDE65961.1 MAG: hypothetical protein D8M57_05320 [Candidatus Scalindua sp. AMX11]
MDTEQFKEVDLSPFKVEKVTIGEREIFNNDRDYQLITFMLSLPDEEEEGVYTIPSFTIPYKDEVNDIEGTAKTSPVALKKVPIMLEAVVDKDVINLGDRVHYQLTVWHEKDLEILKENLTTCKIDPFTLLDCKQVEEVDGRLKKLIVDYGISVYDLAEEEHTLEIPSLPILYYKKTEELLVQEDGEALFETQQINAPAIPILINSVLKKVDVPLESIKGPVTYPQIIIWLRGYLPILLGGIVIVFLGVLEGKKYVSRVSRVVKEKVAESPMVHAERLEALVDGFSLEAEEQVLRKWVVNAGYALRVFLGSLVELPKEKVLSFTTTKMINVLKGQKLANILIESSFYVLKTFDLAIFGDVDKAELQKVVSEIKDLLKEAKRRGYY